MVLEIGFGMGISASFIQELGCAKHVIIEPNHAIMKRCKAWIDTKARSAVVPLAGFWESVTPRLEEASFDGVMFDPFPSAITVPFLKEARRLLRPGGKLAYYSQQWGTEGTDVWMKEILNLVNAGWRNEEFGKPQLLTLDIKDSCPEFPNCEFSPITFVITNVTRGNYSHKQTFEEDHLGAGFNFTEFIGSTQNDSARVQQFGPGIHEGDHGAFAVEL